MPKNRVPARNSKDAPCRRSTRSPSTSLRASSARRIARLLVDVRTDEDYHADPRLVPSRDAPSACRSVGVGGRIRRSFRCRRSARRAPSSAKARPRGCATPDVAADTLEDGFEGWTQGRPAAGDHRRRCRRAIAQRTHRLGHPRTAEGRSHRLSLADPPFRRSPRRVPVRRTRRGRRPSRSGSARRRSTSKACSGAIAARPAPSIVMVEEFGLATEPLLRLATIVRGADTGRMDLAPQAAGLLAASLGLSRMYADDLAQLDAGLDALRRVLPLVPRRDRRDPHLAFQEAGRVR